MRLLVCGGRDFRDVPWMWAELDRLDKIGRISCVIDGVQQAVDKNGFIIGADYWGNQWAIARNRPEERFHADWDAFGKAAGPKRNRRMGEEGKPDLVMPFPRANGDWGAGTKSMVAIARGLGIKVEFPTMRRW